MRLPQYSRALPAACTVELGDLGCFVQVNLAYRAIGDPNAANVPGLMPADLRAAYGLPAEGAPAATGPSIVIVDAYDDPTAESDLAVYRTRAGLAPCTSANGCFTVVKPAMTAYNSAWSQEISLDLAMASAACPSCRLTLMEAQNANPNVLALAVNSAAALSPASISNSFGIPASRGTAHQDGFYDHPGIAIVASSGDDGRLQFPASSVHVIAVGGTSLVRDASARGWHESVWDKSGAGCNTNVTQPAWQQGSTCNGRSVPDVSVTAALNPGIAVYNSNAGGWVVLGGTSAGAPFVAGLYAQAQDFGSSDGAASLYGRLALLNPVDPLSYAPTPGSPNGLGAF